LKNERKNIYRRLIFFAYPYRYMIGLSMVASLGVSATDALTAYLVKPVVDELLVAGNYSFAKLIPVIVVGLSAFKGISLYIQRYNIRLAGQSAVQDIRNLTFGHAMNFSMRYFTGQNSGKLLSRVLNDVNAVQAAVSDVPVIVLRETSSIIMLACYAFFTNWKMAAIAFIVIPASSWPASVIGKRIKKYSKRGQSAMGEVTAVVQQGFAGVKVVKAFATEDIEIEKFRGENDKYLNLIKKTLRYSAGTAPIMELMTSIGIAVVLWYGLSLIQQGAMTQGDLVSILAAIGLMYSPLKRLVNVNNTIQRSLGAAERVFEVLDTQAEITDSVTAVALADVKGDVIFDRVDFAYEDEPVLRDFSVTAMSGEVVALVGPSGAGKSTFIGLLNRFYDPQRGRILIDNVDIREVTQKSLHDQLALVDQETFLFNDTIANNIAYGRQLSEPSAVERAAKQAYADEFIRQLPDGYQTIIGDRGVRLSGGQRQRISIARAILRDAPILLLDEATSALDTESEAMVQKALQNLMEYRTTFVIAHRLSTVMHADKILVLDQGRIVEQGTHQQLLQQEGLYRRLFDVQFGEKG
jgi:subfamily B ATP-binding cassette protein MsbA